MLSKSYIVSVYRHTNITSSEEELINSALGSEFSSVRIGLIFDQYKLTENRFIRT
ncbi:hypothetical protein CANTEDRAFT_112807 [Yamadazyma tenuis ATCC 10573]|uniref:Uncharacterized protein n=1 Tax=Candida tenuis (strain ATCC 10573 / BCRC 21748 / CBS 615 / JCM 9827 / NBRC 10315 / NRRL Y-1498 / VKM Y-70) TaxID=590646 RepID=G3AYU2_CANTC|nr:uncharacterized protein CANTEDRAFT_112807 [Yamadazyma tenuis ATCC 10573]EGV65930.1 hypothetical protein CANTEDRAFT_112807 [Yamadazyma tenuis ATCC 10573]